MPSTEDLRVSLRELADSATDLPEMPVTRAARPSRAAGSVRPVLVAVGLLAVLLGIGLTASRYDLLPGTPAAGPTRAVPGPATPSPAMTDSPPTTPPTPAPTLSPRSAGPATRPMTQTEITHQTARCLTPAAGFEKYRRGGLEVRYARVQAVVGYPSNSTPRNALLLEDADGYYDCSSDYGTYISKTGDDVHVDRSAAGVELPTLSGGSVGTCDPPRKNATVDSAVVLKTSARARTARVTVSAAGGTRTATLPTRNGYVYIATRVSGGAAWKPSKFTVELFDADGERLLIEQYARSTTERLTYNLIPCTPTAR